MRCSLSLFASLFVLSANVYADETINLLQTLTNAPGVAGYETPIRNIVWPLWQKNLSSMKADNMGNLIGTLRGPMNSPTLLIMGHLDEVGFQIRSITKDGFVEVEPLGGVEDHTSFGQRWTIMTNRGPILGYSGVESGHLVPRPGQTNKPDANLYSLRDMTIDVGARSQQEAMNRFGLRPGLPVSPATEFTVLNGTDRYLAKGLDDRVGLAIITELLSNANSLQHPNQLLIAATVQEELGLRGAQVVAHTAKPDVVINLEACIAGDFPLHSAPSDAYPELGKGPCLYVRDQSMVPNAKLVDWVIAVAKENNLPYQFADGLNYGQDGSVFQQTDGTPVINIGIPVRYAHQQSGVMQRSDYDATLKLVRAIIAKLDAKQLKSISFAVSS